LENPTEAKPPVDKQAFAGTPSFLNYFPPALQKIPLGIAKYTLQISQ